MLGAVALLGAQVAVAAPAVNVTGTWHSTYHCSTGWCAGQAFPDTITLHQVADSAAVTGTDQLGAVIAGSLSGRLLTLHYTLGSYVVDYAVAIAPDGRSWSGTARDSDATTGTDSATWSSASSSGAERSPAPSQNPPGDIGANADFVGTWGSSAGGWRIASQQPDGDCTGTSDFAGYLMSGCKVTGDHYVFTLTSGSYTSHDSGTISGNTVSGSFHDSNGTVESYTATRSATVSAAAAPGTSPPSRDQSSIAASLATPSDAFGSLGHDIAVLAIAAAATLLIVFPAQLFNHTLEENYADLTGILERRLGRLYRAAKTAGTSLGERRDRVRLALVVLIGAYLGGLLDPTFGLSWRSLETYLGMILATAVSVALGAAVASRYRRHRSRGRTVLLTALPLGLFVAAGCMLVSRITRFEPGYLYGVVAGVGFAEELDDREDAHVTALAVVASLAAATLCWLLWDVVNRPATHAGFDVPLIVLDDVLAAVFAGGLTGAVISLLPLKFLPGGKIAAWHKGAWGAIFTAALVGLVGVLLWPNRDRHSGSAPIATIVILFVAFAAVSVGFWRFFDLRKKKREHENEHGRADATGHDQAGTGGASANEDALAHRSPSEPAPQHSAQGLPGEPGEREPAPVPALSAATGAPAGRAAPVTGARLPAGGGSAHTEFDPTPGATD